MPGEGAFQCEVKELNSLHAHQYYLSRRKGGERHRDKAGEVRRLGEGVMRVSDICPLCPIGSVESRKAMLSNSGFRRGALQIRLCA